MATATDPISEMYVGESFRAFVIRRGLSFWTGRGWDVGPYRAKLFGQYSDAEVVIDRLSKSAEPTTVRQIKLTMVT